MRRLIFSHLFLAAIIIFSSCSDKQYQILFQQRNSISDSLTRKNPTSTKYYQIQAQDILQIRNLQDDKFIVNQTPANLNTTTGNNTTGESFQVKDDGTVTMPDIGTVQVAGLTRIEAQKLIEDMFRKTLLKDPIIELKITNLKVTIFGEVKTQGNFPLVKDKTTLVELIGEAGGLTEKADEKNIEIIRGTENNPKVIAVDFSNIRYINDPSTVLQSGDIVYIAQNRRAARSDNLQNFSTIFQPVLILFNTALILYTLIHK